MNRFPIIFYSVYVAIPCIINVFVRYIAHSVVHCSLTNTFLHLITFVQLQKLYLTLVRSLLIMPVLIACLPLSTLAHPRTAIFTASKRRLLKPILASHFNRSPFSLRILVRVLCAWRHKPISDVAHSFALLTKPTATHTVYNVKLCRRFGTAVTSRDH
jgi:hypothetical protein